MSTVPSFFHKPIRTVASSDSEETVSDKENGPSHGSPLSLFGKSNALNSLRSTRILCDDHNRNSNTIGNHEADKIRGRISDRRGDPKLSKSRAETTSLSFGVEEGTISNAASSTDHTSRHCNQSSKNHPSKEILKKEVSELKKKLNESERRIEESLPVLQDRLSDYEFTISKLNNELAIARGEHAAVVESLHQEIRNLTDESWQNDSHTSSGQGKDISSSRDATTKKQVKQRQSETKHKREPSLDCSEITEDPSPCTEELERIHLEKFSKMTSDLTESLNEYYLKVERLEMGKVDMESALQKMESDQKILEAENNDLRKRVEAMQENEHVLRDKLDYYEEVIEGLDENVRRSNSEQENAYSRILELEDSLANHQRELQSQLDEVNRANLVKAKMQASNAVVTLLSKQSEAAAEKLESLVSTETGEKFHIQGLERIYFHLTEKLGSLSALSNKANQLLYRLDLNEEVHDDSGSGHRSDNSSQSSYENNLLLMRELENIAEMMLTKCCSTERTKLELESALFCHLSEALMEKYEIQYELDQQLMSKDNESGDSRRDLPRRLVPTVYGPQPPTPGRLTNQEFSDYQRSESSSPFGESTSIRRKHWEEEDSRPLYLRR